MESKKHERTQPQEGHGLRYHMGQVWQGDRSQRARNGRGGDAADQSSLVLLDFLVGMDQ